MKVNYRSLFPPADLFKKPSVLVIIFSFCFAFWFLDFWKPYNTAKKETNFHWDVFNYYSYLPAAFCNDGSFNWKNNMATFYNPYGPLNNHLPKTTYGMAILYSPFFALGYKVAYNQKSPLDGFSEPFATAIRWGSIFYVLLGMIFLRRFLLYFFNEAVTAVTLFASLFGTMLFMYTYGMSELAHGYLFALFSVFLFLTHKWHQQPKLKYTIWIGLVVGLISLIRPTEIYIVVFFIFWGVRSWSALKEKVRFFMRKYPHILLIMLLGLLLWIPQLLFWKAHTGTFLYDSYPGERFFWGDPQIFNILFSYRKGWLTYTPMVLLCFIGFFFIKKDFPISPLVFALLTCGMIYVLSCWWDWFFGGCFGARGFCQFIAFLAIPFAALLDYFLYSHKKFLLKGTFSLLIVIYIFSCICLNLGQSYQFQHTRIHPFAMSEKVYWDVFRTYHWADIYGYTYWGDLDQPDYKKLKSGENRDQ